MMPPADFEDRDADAERLRRYRIKSAATAARMTLAATLSTIHTSDSLFDDALETSLAPSDAFLPMPLPLLDTYSFLQPPFGDTALSSASAKFH